MTTQAMKGVDPATLRRVICAAAIGNFVEWFDFAVYGFLATTIAMSSRMLGTRMGALFRM